jgi:integrase/recombinase XerD
MVWHIVKKWGEFTGIGKLSPHDLRRTAITRALEQGLTYAQIQLMSGHSDPKGIMRYDRQRQSIELNAINYLSYDETKA